MNLFMFVLYIANLFCLFKRCFSEKSVNEIVSFLCIRENLHAEKLELVADAFFLLYCIDISILEVFVYEQADSSEFW